jgi:hypothetical protein
LKENNFLDYSRKFIKNLNVMPDHRKVKLAEHIKSKINKQSLIIYVNTNSNNDTQSTSPNRNQSHRKSIKVELPAITTPTNRTANHQLSKDRDRFPIGTPTNRTVTANHQLSKYRDSFPIETETIRKTNQLSKYKAVVPLKAGNVEKNPDNDLKLSRQEVLLSLDKMGLKSTIHKRNKTMNYMLSRDFYY